MPLQPAPSEVLYWPTALAISLKQAWQTQGCIVVHAFARGQPFLVGAGLLAAARHISSSRTSLGSRQLDQMDASCSHIHVWMDAWMPRAATRMWMCLALHPARSSTC
jgi:hypothetical protein